MDSHTRTLFWAESGYFGDHTAQAVDLLRNVKVLYHAQVSGSALNSRS